MAKEVSEWDVVDAGNNFAVPDGWPEGMARSEVNNVGRANMGSVRRWYDDPEYLDLTQGASVSRVDSVTIKVLGGDYTSYFTAGRRIKLTGGAVDPFYAHVDASAVNAGDTDVSLLDPSDLAGVPAETGTFAVTLHSCSGLRSSAFTGRVQFSEVTVLTGDAIQSAIDSLEADNGGIILLVAGATYIVGTQIDIGLGSSGGLINIIGNHATLQADTGLDDSVLLVSGEDNHFEDIRFDGNRSNQTGTADTGTVELAASALHITFNNCEFSDSYGHHIKMISGNHCIWVTAAVMNDSGEDGVKVLDPDSDVMDIYIRDCHITNPSDRSGVTEGACINMAGSGFVWGCTFNGLNHATDTQIGIICAEKKAASPTDQSGHEIQITSCIANGTGDNAYGARLEGRDCNVLGSTFNLSGANSVGIDVNQPLVADVSSGYAITGCQFIDCGAQGININDDTKNIAVTGNVMTDCDTGIRSDADSVSITGNMISGGATAVSIQGNSAGSLVTANHLTDQSSDAVVVAVGAATATVRDNSILNPGGVAVNDSGTDSVVELNTGTTGATSATLSAEQIAVAYASEAVVHSSLILAVPTSCDGVRQFRVSGSLKTFISANTTFSLAIRMGTNYGGTITLDPIVWSAEASGGTSSVSRPVSNPGALCTPSPGDSLYWTAIRTAGAGLLSIFGDDSAATEGTSDIAISRELES